MNIVNIIEKKRDKNELNQEEIEFFIKGVTNDTIPDYQISALLMAIYLNGMTEKELAVLTNEMAKSGDHMKFDIYPVVDKHSSGGVGDKISLIISPMVASCGLPIAKLSGRGLGYSGGTVDKLESIPGYRTDLSPEEFSKNVKEIGIALIGQSKSIAPADKKMYALRDVTGTVSSIPLIAASIMSKKLADGSDKIVLDVKCGSGAFMKTLDDAKKLAEAMVSIGEHNGKETIGIISNMDEPLGRNVGNALEVIEAVEFLNGNHEERLYDLSLELASEMLILGEKAKNVDEAKKMLVENLENGKALEKFRQLVIAQGGDVSYIDDLSKFQKTEYKKELFAEKDGYISSVNTENIGRASGILGGGRMTAKDEIDPRVGIIINKRVGDKVEKGELILTLYFNDESKIDSAYELCEKAYIIGNESKKKDIILGKVKYER